MLDLEACTVAVEQAFKLHGEGKTAPQTVQRVLGGGGGFHIKAGVLTLGKPYFAAKANGNFPNNAPVVVQDVRHNSRYLTTFGSTLAEAIFPVLSGTPVKLRDRKGSSK